MFVERYMTRDPVTIQEDRSIMEALQILCRNKIRKLPVMRGEELVGIVTSKDLKEGAPSEATSLDRYELNYLLSTREIRELMTPDPVTIRPEVLIEQAALIMYQRQFESLPVVDAAGKLVGIITESDLFRYLVDLSGITEGGIVLDLVLPDVSGSIREVTDVMRSHGSRILSILATYRDVQPGYRRVMIRVKEGDLEAVKEEVRRKFPVVSVAG
jgi:acetoin utilization protein AcuB